MNCLIELLHPFDEIIFVRPTNNQRIESECFRLLGPNFSTSRLDDELEISSVRKAVLTDPDVVAFEVGLLSGLCD